MIDPFDCMCVDYTTYINRARGISSLSEEQLRANRFKYLRTISDDYHEADKQRTEAMYQNNIEAATLRKNKTGAYQLWVRYRRKRT